VRPADTFSVTTPSPTEVMHSREFAAPRELVLDAYTKPELLRRWFGPHGWTLVECEIELRIGGAWRYVVAGPDDARMTLHGTYLEIVRPERLVVTENNGDCHARAEHEALTTTTFADLGGRTLLTTLVRYPSRDVRDAVLGSGMEHGVAQGFERLAELLGTTGAQ
jgi:uncharacterized protein YndB with AHSA1/START domain